jgi:hypothetical protein
MLYSKLQSTNILFSMFRDILPDELIHTIVSYSGRVLCYYKPLRIYKIKEIRKGKFFRRFKDANRR